MDPTERIDIDRFDSWLDELARGFASPSPADASDLAHAARWLHEKGTRTMSSHSFQQRLAADLQPAIAGRAPAVTAAPAIPKPTRPVAAISVRATPRRWLLSAAAIALLALPLVVLLSRSFSRDTNGPIIPAPVNGLVQAGTPVPCSVAPPARLEISGTPVNDAILFANTNRPYPNAPGSGGPVLYQADLPTGPPASQDDVADIQQTLAMFAVCLYEGETDQLDAFFSDDSFRRSGLDRTDEPQPTVTPNPTLAWIPTPIRPLDDRVTPVTPVILQSNVLADGRVGVLLEQDITGYGLQEYFIMVRSERGWLIDEEVMVTPETQPSPEATSLTIPITAIDLQFQPSRIEIPADVDVTLVVTNQGQARKTFVIPELDIAEELPAGESITVVINAPKGVYEFYSDVSGQKAAGMSGWIVAIPGS